MPKQETFPGFHPDVLSKAQSVDLSDEGYLKIYIKGTLVAVLGSQAWGEEGTKGWSLYLQHVGLQPQPSFADNDTAEIMFPELGGKNANH